MTKTKPETGDWRVEVITEDVVKMYRILNRRGLWVGDFADFREVTLAAAAPDLLEAIKRLIADLEPAYMPGSIPDSIDAGRAAIARAEEVKS